MPVTLYSRYYGLGTVTRDGQQSLAARPLPPLVDYPDGLVHVMVAGETLDQLAFTYYGREDLWWRIADANPGRFPLDWSPGDTVLIPPIRVATRTAGR
jgi:nucleoid-associated protein YgaU